MFLKFFTKIIDARIEKYLNEKCPKKCTAPVKKLQKFKGKKDEIINALKTPKITQLKLTMEVSNGDSSVDIWEKADSFPLFYNQIKNLKLPEETKYISSLVFIIWFNNWVGKESHIQVKLSESLNDTFEVNEFDKFRNLILDSINEFPEEFL